MSPGCSGDARMHGCAARWSHSLVRRALTTANSLDATFPCAVCLSPMRRSSIAGALLLLTFALQAWAVDQPLDARKLTLRRTASGQEKLSFLTKDPNIPFPAIGSADDPAKTSGVVIELFSQNAGQGTLVIPNAVGWLTRDGSPSLYKFVNKLAPTGVSTISSFLLKNGKAIRVRGASTGLPSGGTLGPVGIRITMGSLRACALFDAT